MDLVVRVPRLPVPGETVLGGQFLQAAGGKGANQAVAAARLGGDVSMIGCVGADAFGRELVQALRGEGIDTSGIREVAAATGVASIVVDDAGENSIAVASGANALLEPGHVSPEALAQADVLVAQLETPIGTVAHAIQVASAAGLHTVLNAAPAADVPLATLEAVDVLIVNEEELAILLGGVVIPEGQEAAAARRLVRRPGQTVVVTLGGRGALAVDDDGVLTQPAWRVSVVDTTAAGDAFVAAFAVRRWTSGGVADALRFACAVGALATTRAGAQPSLPMVADVQAFMDQATAGAPAPGVDPRGPSAPPYA